MTITQRRKLGMLLKVHGFYVSNGSVFNPIPHFPPLITELDDLIKAISHEAGISEQDLSGATIAKTETRTGLEAICLKVGMAVRLFGVNNSEPYIIEEDDYFSGNLETVRDSELLVLALQLHGKAQPVEGSLAPYSCSPADVLKLKDLAQSFLEQIKVSRNNRRSRTRSVKKVKGLFTGADVLLEKSDDFLVVYRYINNNLWLQYRTARHIDKLGGGKNVHKKQGQVLPAGVAYAPFSKEVLKGPSKMIFTNENKEGDLLFYFSARPNELPLPETKLTKAAAGKSIKITAQEAGYTVHNTHLNIRNPNVKRGSWKAEVKE